MHIGPSYEGTYDGRRHELLSLATGGLGQRASALA